MADKKSGNFADDPKRASEAGKKGGEHSHAGPHQTDQIGHKETGKSGNFADNPKKASEAGKKAASIATENLANSPKGKQQASLFHAWFSWKR